MLHRRVYEKKRVKSAASQLADEFKEKMQENGNYNQCMKYLETHDPMFETYESFCEYAMKDYNKQ